MPNCAVCDSRKLHEKFEKYSCRFIECDQCGFIFIFPPAKPEALAECYGQTFYKSWGMEGGDESIVREMKMKTAVALLKQVENVRSTGTLLDIGCAAGHFLEAAAGQGWEVYGVEISDYASALARRKFGERIYAGPFETAPFPEAFFDCILMSDVLEHFRDPHSALEKIWLFLKEGGILVIVTPDTGSLSARVLKRSWNHYEKEHLIYFNRKNIKLYLEKNDLLPLVVKTSRKAMNLKYMYSQMTAYPHPIFTPTIRFINKALPEALLMNHFSIASGDMLVIAQKMEKKDVIYACSCFSV